jgi:hypothetical protein
MKNFKYFLIMLLTLTFTVSCVEDDNVYVAPSPWVDVETTTVSYTEGPLKSVKFPNNPIPGDDVNVELQYSSSETILEARIYYATGNSPVYVKDNRIKGEDDASFTQTGVTINMVNQSQSGVKTSFYVRMATASGEYYYGNDPNGMALDNFNDIDESDDFKGDPTGWNVFTAQ